MVFEDRIAKYPGRWTMVKSDGSSEVVTLVRNDEPTKEGTPINAATLNELSTVAGAINAKEEAVSAASAANTAATSAGKSAQAASEDAGKAASSAAAAKASADKAAAAANTDKTFTIEGAPADAKATGDALNDRYTKGETDELLKSVNPFPVGSIYHTVSFASPALTFGGIWSELDAGTVELPVKNMHIWERMGYLLNIRAPAGSTLTITDGETTIEDTVDDSSRYARELPVTGTWTVTVSCDDDMQTETRVIDKYGVFTVDFITKTFGVVWDYGGSSTALTRLTKASDPYHFVTTDITAEPIAAVGVGTGSSPFDAYMPWCGMEEYNIVDGVVSAKRGEEGFSRVNNDTMVLIPEFYYKVVDDATNKKRYFYISNTKFSGFGKHPGSGRYVGKYNTASGYVSKTGFAPLVNVTRNAARSGAKAKGSGWYEYDYASWCAIGLLYVVEYADWNCQRKIGRGYVDSHSSPISSGGTDSMTYHTGRASGTDGSTAVQYRHIENPWGNVSEWVDGVNFSNDIVYMCTNPSKYADDVSSNYTNIGAKAQSEGYTSSTGYSSIAPWSFYPTATNGSASTCISDFATYDSGWRVLRVSGYWAHASEAGLFYFLAHSASSSSYSHTGARLMYIPQ